MVTDRIRTCAISNSDSKSIVLDHSAVGSPSKLDVNYIFDTYITIPRWHCLSVTVPPDMSGSHPLKSPSDDLHPARIGTTTRSDSSKKARSGTPGDLYLLPSTTFLPSSVLNSDSFFIANHTKSAVSKWAATGHLYETSIPESSSCLERRGADAGSAATPAQNPPVRAAVAVLSEPPRGSVRT
ncbi:hypothetical protein J6590_027797 [Homalodisca vitripennis]|nr:hypothetical protein J6590_027797 [Homalodisca vitripennis]